MIKYIGKGSFVQGVPARDLSEEEWSAYSEDKQNSLLQLGLFAAPRPKRKVKETTLEPVEGAEE